MTNTGQKMVEWNQLDVTSFLDQVTGFLSEHGQLDGQSSQPPAKRARSVSVHISYFWRFLQKHCVFASHRRLLSVYTGEFDRCQWGQSVRGRNPGLSSRNTLRVLPGKGRVPFRWWFRCRTFLWQRRPDLSGWFRLWGWRRGGFFRWTRLCRGSSSHQAGQPSPSQEVPTQRVMPQERGE